MALGKATWLRLLSVLFALTSSFCESSHEDEGFESSAFKVLYVNVTDASKDKVSLVASVNCHSPEECRFLGLVWQYSQQELTEAVWQKASVGSWGDHFEHDDKTQRRGLFYATIEDLRAATEYNVRALVWETSCKMPWRAREGTPVARTVTCAEFPQSVDSIYIEDKGTDFITISWSAPANPCVSTAYYIHWSEYEESDEWGTTMSSPYCPSDAVFVTNSTDRQCYGDMGPRICYTIKENITHTTRYCVKIYTTDASKNCSSYSAGYYTTAFKHWGGISVGVWCLIVLCVVLAIGAMPFVIHLKRRMALKFLNRETMVFRRSRSTEDGCPDEERDPDGYLISAST